MGVPSLNDLAVNGTLNTINQLCNTIVIVHEVSISKPFRNLVSYLSVSVSYLSVIVAFMSERVSYLSVSVSYLSVSVSYMSVRVSHLSECFIPECASVVFECEGVIPECAGVESECEGVIPECAGRRWCCTPGISGRSLASCSHSSMSGHT